MSECEYSRRLNRAHDGELPPEEARELETHLRRCERCTRERERLERLSGLLQSARAPDMPAPALRRLHEAVRGAEPAAIGMLRLARRMSLAAAVVLAVSALWLMESAQVPLIEPPSPWESAATAYESGALADASNEELQAQWIVRDPSGWGDQDE